MPRTPSIACAVLIAAAIAAGCGRSSGSSVNSAQPMAIPMHMGGAPADTSHASYTGDSVLHFTLDRLNGEPDNLTQYRGKVVLVVNTATECGFTPQFEQLEKLYEAKKGEGFVILGFPADDVAHQEPRDDAAISEFCKANFGVTFPMFTKSNVVDEPLNPLYKELTAAQGPPDWNFNKYLLDRQGRPLQRWGPETAPDDPELTGAIDAQLAPS
jgi:glutathione peroxidase